LSEATEVANGESHVRRRIEVATTVLLALAAVATAWASYQSSRWHGKQAEAQSLSVAKRVESTRASGVANRQAQIDVATFTQWVNAYAEGNMRLADFYRKRFRSEFKPAVEAWIATRPLKNPRAPLTPFAMPEYKLAASGEADRLEAEAGSASQRVQRYIQRADNYTLCVVLFAASLFFAGISTRLRTRTAQVAILVLGWVLFLGTVAWLGTFPTTVSV
jgi:hypothetical protein